jgi:hypothetical protein
MSTASISDSPIASDVLIAQAVLDRLEKLAETSSEQATAVAAAIQNVGRAKASSIKIHVSNGPPGAKYMALAPSDPDAPVIIYRALTQGEDHAPGWLVTTLLSPDEYRRYREAESTGLLDDPMVQGLLLAGFGAFLIWLMSRSGKPQ